MPLSALQHYLFCPRQCALIHMEQLWEENGATAEGRLLHERVDSGQPDRRAGVRVARGLAIRSFALGVAGRADAVEFHGKGRSAVPFPIEYKRGRPKAHRADEVQICAQALCLEEMLGIQVLQGALFYGQTRRRVLVDFDAELRSLTFAVATQVHEMLAIGSTPPPVAKPSCKSCSLMQLCRPDRLEAPPVISDWLSAQIGEPFSGK